MTVARIPSKKAGARTKERIAQDLAFVLNSGELHIRTKMAVIKNALWAWSEFDGKYRGCQWWSVAAQMHRKKTGNVRGLVHEHVVPRKLIRNWLLNCSTKVTPKEIFDRLNQFCFGVVVTKEEDRLLNDCGLQSQMPKDWDEIDPWARYKVAMIQVVRLSEPE